MLQVAGTITATVQRAGSFRRVVIALGAAVIFCAVASTAFAAPPDLILSDANLRAQNSMTVAQIQAYLNTQPGPLKSLVTSDYDKVITLSSSHVNVNMTPDTGEAPKPASQIIWEACQQWHISPMVMLTMLQKEQSLLTRTSLTSTTLARAIGAGCPNGTSNRYPGFGNQMWHGARLLDGYGEGKNGSTIPLYVPGMSFEDIYAHKTLHPGTLATYKLYVYNPSISGNTNFYNIYLARFGDPMGEPAISIPDPRLESVIRATLGKPSGGITDFDMKTLTTLSASGLGISELSGLERATNLTNLYLDGNKITDISPLTGLTKLTALRLNSNQISDITPVAGMTKLTLLGLIGNPITNIAPVAGLTGLTDLWLSSDRITDITPVSGLTNLTTLLLDRNQFTNITPVAGLTKLTSLDLADNRITEIAPVAGLTALKRLGLEGCQITSITSLAGLTELTDLDLDGNQIAGITPVAGLTKLTSLDLADNRITDIASVDPLSALTSLGLSYNYLVLTPGSPTMVTIAAVQGRGASVTYEPQKSGVTFTLTPSATVNGSISPNTPQTVDEGSDRTFGITADAGYHVTDVLVDGASVGRVATYKFTDVKAGHTIGATFAPTTYLPVYRFYNKKNGSHFYTASEAEKNNVQSKLSATYGYDGPAYKASSAYTTPLYRFYNKKNGSHFYTASESEKNSVIKNLGATYAYDGPAYDVTTAPAPGSAPVYRFFNKKNGSHFYTASVTEKAAVLRGLAATYKLEGPAFYVTP